MSVMKIMTHSGQNATAYILSGSPIFFQVETKLYPTGLRNVVPYIVADIFSGYLRRFLCLIIVITNLHDCGETNVMYTVAVVCEGKQCRTQ